MGLLELVLFHWKLVLEKIFPAVLEDQMVFFEIFLIVFVDTVKNIKGLFYQSCEKFGTSIKRLKYFYFYIFFFFTLFIFHLILYLVSSKSIYILLSKSCIIGY